jgi:hypothetical protein
MKTRINVAGCCVAISCNLCNFESGNLVDECIRQDSWKAVIKEAAMTRKVL